MPTNDSESAIRGALLSLTGGTGGLTAEEVLRVALSAQGGSTSEKLESLTRQIEQLRQASQAGSEAVRENTEALRANTSSQGAGILSQAAQVAWQTLGGFGAGLTLSPLLSGVLGLFKRERKEEPAVLTRYVRPPAVNFFGTAPRQEGGAFLPVDYEAGDIPRTGVPAVSAAATNVVVQVNTMDSRSFMDHSDEIAQAVRQAMLNAHALNDLVGEL